MSTDRDTFKIEFEGIGSLLKKSRLRVPKYQRSFAWEAEQVNELLDDIVRAMDSKEKEYFVGSIVIASGEDGTPEVVDGQQRLAVAAILLAEICRRFRGWNDPAADAIEQFLTQRDRRTQEESPRLQLNDNDNRYFQSHILKATGEDDLSNTSRLSHKRLLRAKALAEACLQRLIGRASSPAECCHDLVDYLEAKVKAILVTAPSHANAFMIFETLNDRGLALAPSDLLKNFLFHQSKGRIGETQSSWTQMYALFEASDNEKDVVDFIRQMWSSHHGLTREKELYQQIKEIVKAPQQAVDLAARLEAGARLYQAMLNPNHPFWNDFVDAVRASVRDLIILGVTRNRPLILAVVEEMAPVEVRKALKLMVDWAVRFMITGGLGTGTLEEYYCERAKEIRNKKIKTAVQLRTAMEGLVPNDAKFRGAFAQANLTKKRVARYVLRELERIERGDVQPELTVNQDKEQVNLEHVLPDRPSKDWGVQPDIAQAYVDRIGNLALISERRNVEAGNKPPKEKAKYFAKSELLLTQAIAETIDATGNWGPANIDERQQRLADLAVKAWSTKF